MTVKTSKTSQGQDAGDIKLLDERIEEIPPKGCIAFPINFSVENADTYIMSVEMQYTSARFTD